MTRSLMALLCACLALPISARASVLAGDLTTDGNVNALIKVGHSLYLGGQFGYVGPTTGSAVPVSATTGAPNPLFPNVDGHVNAIVPDGAGGYYLGGHFDTIGGIPRSDLAHVTANGTLDPAWNPGVNGTVNALALAGSTLYVGGTFTEIGGQPRHDIAALSSTGAGTATAWAPNANGAVLALALDPPVIFAGGSFTTIGGQARRDLAALSSTGAGLATSWDAGASDTGAGLPPEQEVAPEGVDALAVAGPTLYAGGGFTTIGGQLRSNIAALSTGTAQATAWNPHADFLVLALAVSGSTVYAGGTFGSIGGRDREGGLAALSAAGSGRATGWNPNPTGALGVADVYGIAVAGPTVYVGGDFDDIGGAARTNVAAVSATGPGRATSWQANTNDEVDAVALTPSGVLIGGFFTSVGGEPRHDIAQIDLRTERLTAWHPDLGGIVQAFALSGSTLYVGGGFYAINGGPGSTLFTVDTHTGRLTVWHALAQTFPSEVTGPGFVEALALDGSTLYAGGQFYRIAGQPRVNLAAFDTRTGRLTAWTANALGPSYPAVEALALAGPTLFVGGRFVSIGGQPRHNLAALDAATGEPAAWAPVVSGRSVTDVEALALSGATVFIGGSFARVDGRSRLNIAAVDAVSGRVRPWDPNATGNSHGPLDSFAGDVTALGVSGSTVYAGGYFTRIGGQPRQYLAGIAMRSGRATSWNPSAPNPVLALTIAGARLYAAFGPGS